MTDYPTDWVHHRLAGCIWWNKQKQFVEATLICKTKKERRFFSLKKYGTIDKAKEAAEKYQKEWVMKDPFKRSHNPYRHLSETDTEIWLDNLQRTVLVSSNRLDEILKFGHWCGIPKENGACYAYHAKKQGNTMMHRFLLDAPSDKVVDHIDGNGLNNRTENIRLATLSENSRNMKLSIRNKTGVNGLRHRTHNNGKNLAFVVSLWVNGTQKTKSFSYGISRTKKKAKELALVYLQELKREGNNNNGIRSEFSTNNPVFLDVLKNKKRKQTEQPEDEKQRKLPFVSTAK
jgi:hypothetical protein